MPELDPTSWRKSSRSSGGANNCVELPGTRDAVRDSKNHQVLRLSEAAVQGLLAAVSERPRR